MAFYDTIYAISYYSEVYQLVKKLQKDYIMRMIKEMVQVLFSLVFGKINKAENLLLEDLDYTNKEEVLLGFEQLLEKSGYKDLVRLIGGVNEEGR